MRPEKQPTQMIIDQINLLNSEERKLKKFVDYNKNAQETVEVHLREIQKRKERLYHLCTIMGIDHLLKKSESHFETESESVQTRTLPHPTGRFGSVLINGQD